MRLLLAALLAAAATAAAAQDIKVYTSDDPLLEMRSFRLPGGKTLPLTVGIGSAAFRHPSDPPNVIWTLSDRGPNIACSDAKEFGLNRDQFCKAARGGRIYPVPAYAPSIYRVMLLEDGSFRVTDVITLKDSAGRPVLGLTNPLKTASTETPLDGQGRVLPQHPANVDAEALVRLADGSFWIGEENAPSILQVAADGRILRRFVPIGTDTEFAGAGYEVIGLFPAIVARRQSNRGIESIAVSPDEKFLYTMLQNPLANPDSNAFRKARNTRLFKIDRVAMKVIGEYVYQLSDPRSFRLDPSDNQSAPRISEMMAIGEDRLVVLERTEGTTHLYTVTLAGATDIQGSRWDDPNTSPSLEQAGEDVTPVGKTLLFDSAGHKEIPGKIEGLARLPDGSLVMVNDDDFGIAGGTTKIIVVRGLGLPRN